MSIKPARVKGTESGSAVPVPLPRPFRVEVPQLAGLDAGPLDELLDVPPPDADSTAPALRPGVRQHEVGRQLAAPDQAVNRVELEAKQPARLRHADPVIAAGRLRHGPE